MHRVRMLKHYGVIPYVVFDGGYLPSKASTEHDRAEKRKEQKELALQHEASGNTKAAFDAFQRAVDITPEMAFKLVEALRTESVNYIVAPYEADAQLAYLERTGVVSAILTEDSDLLVFGCKTLLVKMDQYGGCIEIKRERFANVTGVISLHGWTDERFRQMAILSGCDYLPNIPNLGLKTAYRLLRKYKTVEKVDCCVGKLVFGPVLRIQ